MDPSIELIRMLERDKKALWDINYASSITALLAVISSHLIELIKNPVQYANLLTTLGALVVVIFFLVGTVFMYRSRKTVLKSIRERAERLLKSKEVRSCE